MEERSRAPRTSPDLLLYVILSPIVSLPDETLYIPLLSYSAHILTLGIRHAYFILDYIVFKRYGQLKLITARLPDTDRFPNLSPSVSLD